MKSASADLIKIALDEVRMLVLVAEVMVGFSYQSVFQPGFDRRTETACDVFLAAFFLLLITFGILMMIPSRHSLVENGRVTQSFSRFTSRTMMVVLFPFALALAMEVYVVSESLLGGIMASALAGGFLVFALSVWFIIPFLRALSKKHEESLFMSENFPPLRDRINHLLTECRVVLPGTQALLGFQLIAFFTYGFDELEWNQKIIHLAALVAILISAVLLMLPAIYHRIGDRGEDSEHLLRISRFCLVSALVALATGISLDFYVVAKKVLGDYLLALAGAVGIFLIFVTLWFAWPISLRSRCGPTGR